MTELEQIRDALNLSQAEMGKMLGASAQSTYHRWATSPNARSSREALERAKDVYRKKKGKAWEAPAASPTPDAYADLDRRLKVLEAAFQALAPLAIAVKDLDERVQKLTPRPGSRE